MVGSGEGDFASGGRLASGRSAATTGRSRSSSPNGAGSMAGIGVVGFRTAGSGVVGFPTAGSSDTGLPDRVGGGLMGRGGVFLTAGNPTAGRLAAGRSADTTGRSGSSSDPSAAGKSDGRERRVSALGGPPPLGAAGWGPPPAVGLATKNECPHFGHRILRPVGGTRRSSIWYGALQDSHSTLSIRQQEPNTRDYAQ